MQASLTPANNKPDEDNIPQQEDSDDLLSLDRVVKLQRQRVERLMKEEKELGVRHSNLSRDIQSLAALTKVLVKEKEFAIRHAIDPVKERENEIRSRRINKNFHGWMDRTPEESRERLARMIDTFMQRINDDAFSLTAVRDEEGNVIRYVVSE